jgi:hypothetical protein
MKELDGLLVLYRSVSHGNFKTQQKQNKFVYVFNNDSGRCGYLGIWNFVELTEEVKVLVMLVC